MPIKALFNVFCACHIESKTDVPDLGNEQNGLKTLFPTSGTAENDKYHRSRCRERPKMKKTAVPNVGNTQKHQKWLFPTLGSHKNEKNSRSQSWEHVFCVLYRAS